jgi:hypothetical protein
MRTMDTTETLETLSRLNKLARMRAHCVESILTASRDASSLNELRLLVENMTHELKQCESSLYENH